MALACHNRGMQPFRLSAIRLAVVLPALLAALLAGCVGTPPSPSPGPPSTAALPTAPSRLTGFQIDANASLIAVTVRRGGPFARMGHDHVVASHDVTGMVATDLSEAQFSFRLDQMTVDEAPLRTEAALDTQPSADAIAGTRANMLTRVLEAEKFPVVQLRALPGALPGQVRLIVTLHGVTRSIDTPVTLVRAERSITASGSFTLLQSDFGITPMSVMGGALVVLDPLELRFRIVARR